MKSVEIDLSQSGHRILKCWNVILPLDQVSVEVLLIIIRILFKIKLSAAELNVVYVIHMISDKYLTILEMYLIIVT